MSDERDDAGRLDAEEAQDRRGCVTCPRCDGSSPTCWLCAGEGEVTYREAEEFEADMARRGS